jgi:hypothetical protein
VLSSAPKGNGREKWTRIFAIHADEVDCGPQIPATAATTPTPAKKMEKIERNKFASDDS